MKNIPALILSLVILTPVCAHAQTLSEILTFCQDKYKESGIAVISQCVTDLRFSKVERTQKEVVERLTDGEKRDGEILSEVRKLSGKVDQLATKKSDSAPTQVVQVPTTPGVVVVQTPGAQWKKIVDPTVVSIYELREEHDTLKITSLADVRARRKCGGDNADYAMVTNHGVPIENVWAPDGSPWGFDEIYYDRDGDGTPEGTVFALELSIVDRLQLTWGRDQDIKVVYLRPEGKIVVQGFPVQTVYRPTTQADNPLTGAIACQMDQLEARGGHRVVHAGNMSYAW